MAENEMLDDQICTCTHTGEVDAEDVGAGVGGPLDGWVELLWQYLLGSWGFSALLSCSQPLIHCVGNNGIAGRILQVLLNKQLYVDQVIKTDFGDKNVGKCVIYSNSGSQQARWLPHSKLLLI